MKLGYLLSQSARYDYLMGLTYRIVTSAFQFYCDEHSSIGEVYARFSFCKDADTLRKASERLQMLKDFLA